MSRIGKLAVAVPAGVKPELKGQALSITGKLGTLKLDVHPEIEPKLDGAKIVLHPRSHSKQANALWGTNRALIANMVEGVTKGFTVDLEINGVGYRAALEGKDTLSLQLGYSHDVKYKIPAGIAVKVGEKQTTLSISGADKRLVGQVAAEIRGYRKPEPYKGKGIKYSTEHVRRKEGKKK